MTHPHELVVLRFPGIIYFENIRLSDSSDGLSYVESPKYSNLRNVTRVHDQIRLNAFLFSFIFDITDGNPVRFF